MQEPTQKNTHILSNIEIKNTHVKVKDTLKYRLLQNAQSYFRTEINSKINESAYNVFSIIDQLDEDRLIYVEILKQIMVKVYEKMNLLKEKAKNQLNTNQSSQMSDVSEQVVDIEEETQIYDRKMLGEAIDIKIQRGIACFLGLGICDALGASTEFQHFDKKGRDFIKYDFNDVIKQITKGVLGTRSGKVGIWTDDCSMALCMADSLLLNNWKFEPKNMRYLFHMWLQHGLNNGGRKYSIGLGGNISISMGEFVRNREDYTAQKDKFNNGNGSLMRLAPVPLCFYQNQQQAMQYSEKQSRTTHNGDQAKQCSKLLALIIVRLINRVPVQDWKEVINQSCIDFVNKQNPMETVRCLAMSEQESQELFLKQAEAYGNKFLKFNQTLLDRNWNWKDQKFTYSQCRTKEQPGYIGSYCMDALSMALHTVWHTKSFKEVALVNANLGGDCDTVGAIAGQIAGAIYGISDYMLHLYSQMEDVKTNRFEVFLKAFKLMTRRAI